MTATPFTMAESIDWLFTRLAGTYGAQWTRQWEGTPMTDVKTAWAYELSAYAGNPSAIKHALDNLPERCPNVIQFRNLCRSSPSRVAPEIAVIPADQARVQEALSKLSPAPERGDMKDWARRIMARHESGDCVAAISVRFAKEALRSHLEMTAV
jgi:hypothetical protein